MAKKLFPCGHKGKGRYCHRCEQEKKLYERQESKKKASEEWMRLYESDPVNLRVLNNNKLVKKARQIISNIHEEVAYTNYKGKRMRYDRNVISVPVNRDFRLIFHDKDGVLKVFNLLSHEEYNVKKPGEKT